MRLEMLIPGEAYSDFQRDVDVTTVLAECLGFHSSGPCVHQEVEQKHIQRTTLNDAV